MDFWTLLILLAVVVIGFVVWQLVHGKKIDELDDVLRADLRAVREQLNSLVQRHSQPTTSAPAPSGFTVQPGPATVPPQGAQTPPATTVPAATPAAPAPVTPAELAPAYIDEADFYKALGAAVAAGYSGGVYLNGKMEHNGFGPFDYYEKTSNGNVVRTQRPATVPPPVAAPVTSDVAIGTE